MRTMWMMMTVLSVWALPVQAERNEEQTAAQKRDRPRLVMSVQLSEAKRAVPERNAPLQNPRRHFRRTVPRLGPAPKVHLSGERITDAVRTAETGGDVLTVDCSGAGDHTTIQGAIDAASDGDVIIVLPNTCTEDGHYLENINFLGKAITVRSLDPTDPAIVEATVIDGGQQTQVVRFAQGEGPSSILDGLTLTNGVRGVRCSAASPVIRNCWITGNGPTIIGGGLVFTGSSSSPLIVSCRITDNAATWGGGLYDASGDAIIVNCLIANNLADRGGGVYLAASAIALRNCTIADNQATAQGGGIWAMLASGTNILTNTIVWGNEAEQGANLYLDDSEEQPINISYTNLEGGPLAISGSGQFEWGAGNFMVDPAFVNSGAADYRLGSDSPCIDAGDPDTEVGENDTDFEGQDRLIGCRVDIGADESETFLDCNTNEIPDFCEILDGTGEDTDGNYVLDECEIAVFVDCNNCPGPGSGTEEDPYCLIQEAIEHSFPGDRVVVLPSIDCAGGAYCENIHFLGSTITVQSMEPADPDTVSETVIDGSTNDFSTITFAFGETADSVLDGLTITGGSGTPNVVDPITSEVVYGGTRVGGGILCVSASPTISRCHVIGNVTTHGGGIGVVGSSNPQISHSLIADNTAHFEVIDEGGVWFGTGGGVDVFNSSATIHSCTIQGNVAYQDPEEPGGGQSLAVSGAGINFVSIRPATALHVKNCVIRENVAEGAAWPGGYPPVGGGLFSWSVGDDDSIIVLIKNSLVVDNSAAVGGGLVFFGEQLAPSIKGCTIAGNSYLFLLSDPVDNSPLLISNTIVYANQSPNENAILAFGRDPAYSYCDVETDDGSVVEGLGNINADPLFVDPDNGDYHLIADSPCVDAGDPEFVPEEGETDIDGQPRVVGERIDMGADEFLLSCDGDFDVDGAIGAFDLALLLGSWGTCADPDDCPADLDGDGEVGPFDLALLLGDWGPC